MSKVLFNNKNAVFISSLKASVDDYFKQRNLRKTGNWLLYTKTLTLIPAAVAIYIVLLFVSMPVVLTIVMGGALGFLMACIGFNVMHDANHGSYSSKKWVNNTLGLSINALGGNNFIWKQKHNIIHHTYTNVDGVDDDIAKSPFIRMCRTQVWKPMHKIQHLYTPFLYAVSSLLWILFQDFEKYFKRRVNTTVLSKMTGNDHFVFWFSKAMYVLFYIVLPVLLMGWQGWLVFFLSMHIGLGFVLAIVFQLAHVVEETEFEAAGVDETKMIENEWAVHQVKTTANFSPGNKIISWFAGGLNYQIEHHLFPRISHVHYPALSKIVEAQCRAFDLPYNSIPTMGQAVYSHFRFIKELGQKK